MGRMKGIVLMFFLGVLCGCGLKTDPVSPSAVIPQAINDLHFFQDESQVVLTWTYPEETTIATNLHHINSFLIFRAVVPEKDYCETCPIAFNTTVEIPFNQAAKNMRTREASYTERVLRPGHRYLYKVRTKAGWRLLSDDSNIASFSWESPAAAPEVQEVTIGDSTITLSWQEVSALADGVPVAVPLKYQVYRSTDHKRFTPIGPLVDEREYRDVGLVNGYKYDYKIRAVQVKESIQIFGLSSRVVQAVPQDRTPPVPPHGLMAVAVAEGVKLLWDRSREDDVAGYKIYRRASQDQAWKLLAQTRGGQVYFIDTIQAGQVFSYTVSAFDRSTPSNESIFAKEVTYESF